jgi:hypothetical protein
VDAREIVHRLARFGRRMADVRPRFPALTRGVREVRVMVFVV